MKLTEYEEMLSEKEIVFEWLVKNRISFQELSEAYVRSLQIDKKNYLNIIAGMSTPLISYWQTSKAKPKSQEKFIKAKAAFWLLKSMMFHTAKIEKDLEKCVKDSGYEETFTKTLNY